MSLRILRVLLVCAVLTMVAASAYAQDVTQGPGAVKLEYKFKANELLRYRMDMTMDIVMQMDMAGAESVPPMSGRMNGIIRQRTKKVLPNGDAEVVCAIESMKMDMMGQAMDFPVDKMPTFSYIMTKTGAIKGIEGKAGQDSPFAAMPFGELANYAQISYFPETPVKAGDTWAKDLPFPFGAGTFHVDAKLLRTDASVGTARAVTIQEVVKGNMDMSSMMGAIPNSPGAGTGSGDLTTNSVMYFSPEQGRMLRAEGTGNVRMDMSFGGGDTGPSGMKMDMQMRFEMNLLPEKGK